MINKFSINTQWDKESALYIRKKLIEFNLENVSEQNKSSIDENVSLILRDNNGTILGGLIGYMHWDCLHIDIFWVEDSLRGQGKGKILLNKAEEIALKNGCHLIKLDTFSFQAPEFYKSQGFKVFGVLENFPEGFNHYYLYKKI